jgi:type IV pilus assembly protein PilB
MKRHFVQRRKKLGEIIVEKGKISPERMNALLTEQKECGKPLGQVLLDEGIISNEELVNILAEQIGIPHIHLRKGLVDPGIVHVLPKEKALHFQVIPMFRVNNVLTLATADPYAYVVFDEVQKITNLEVKPVICRASDIKEAIDQAYQEDVNIDEMLASVDDSSLDVVEIKTEKEISEIAEMAEGSPVINMTNMILLRGIRDGASDIHIEPQKDRFRVRIRIDGVLYNLMTPKIDMHPALVSRLKVMANLNISERRIPQDGRIQVHAEGRLIDLRFSSLPTIYGEKVVLRILDKRNVILDINELGFDPGVLDRFKTLLKRPYGLILVCGPTGSGKTTTLYSALNMLNSGEKNIITVEDPVEYQLDNVNQSQVKDAIGLSFARYLKHSLRQDPDILLVGEIRDRETAEIAIQASLTGHLVLSTLHTNDSPSAITRLLEMRVEPYLISSSLLACLAQRLVRTICPECKTDYYAPKATQMELGIDEDKHLRLFKGKGCTACYDSGFKGRTGIHELMEINQDLQSLILENPTLDMLHRYLGKNGQKRLKDLGYEKVLHGETTIEEVRRATSIET